MKASYRFIELLRHKTPLKEMHEAFDGGLGVTYGRAPPGSNLTAEAIEKQPGSEKRGTQKRVPAGRPTRGKSILRYPFLGTKIGSIVGTTETQKSGPKRVPLLGTLSRPMRFGRGRHS